MSDSFDAIFNGEVEQQVAQEEVQHELPLEQKAPEQEVENEVEVEQAASTLVEEGQQTETEEKKDKRDHPIPLPTFLDMRDRAKAAEAAQKQAAEEAAELRRQLESYKNQPVERQTFDPVVDPQGYAQALEARVEQRLFEDRLVRSRDMAVSKYGAEKIDEVFSWATERSNADPQFDHSVSVHADPIEWAFQQYQAAKAIDDFNKDPDAYVRRRAEELGLLQPTVANSAPVQSTTPVEKKTLPRSITNLPAANSASSVRGSNPAEDFNSI